MQHLFVQLEIIIFDGRKSRLWEINDSKRLQYILAPMNLEEILEKAKLQALDLKDVDFSPIRAFRNPHHSSTKSSIFGGGSSNAKMGEVALSNHGVLFF